jgi:hypothetical protein
MLARIRVSVPDRPGSLGRVASVIGSVGANIAQVEVLEAEAGRALDDFHVRVRDAHHLDEVGMALAAVSGVTLVGVQHPAPPTSGHAELELVAHVLADPGRGVQTLVDGAPGAMGADWAVALGYSGGGGAPDSVVASSAAAPDVETIPLTAPMRLAATRWPGVAGVAITPLVKAAMALAVVRDTGPTFHRTELWRLEQVGRIVGPALTPPPS